MEFSNVRKPAYQKLIAATMDRPKKMVASENSFLEISDFGPHPAIDLSRRLI